MTDEVRHRPITITSGNIVERSTTDAEGYFEVSLSNVEIREVTVVTEGSASVAYTSLQIPSNAEFGVISDIDDTILSTGVASRFKWRLIFNTLFKSPWRRRSFEHSSELYNALNKGKKGALRPVFYISNSPWNIFDYLSDYLVFQKFPKGVLLLRDINITWFKKKTIEQQNKYNEIIKVLDNTVNMPFILIGDSGEIDMDIYHSVYQKYPDRVKAIYIRDIHNSKRRDQILALLDKVPDDMSLLFSETSQVTIHAQKQGWIR